MFSFPLKDGVSLRLWEESDVEELDRLIEANLERLKPWMPWAAGHTLDSTRDYLQRSRREWAARESLNTAVIVDGAIAGAVGLNRLDWANRQTELGYWIDGSSEGRGLITAAARALIDHSFGALELHRVVIRAGTENLRSQRVPERLGFTREGVERGGERHADHYLDVVVYSMLAPEWPAPGTSPQAD